MKDSAIIILAAGKGTRMSIEYPKVLAQSDEGELLGILLTEILNTPAKEIIIVVGFQHEKVIEFVRSKFNDDRIKFAIQGEQLGTGHAFKIGLEQVCSARNVFVLLGDVPLVSSYSLERILNHLRSNDLSACFYSMLVYKNNEYGRVIRDFYSGRVISIEEYRDCSTYQKLIREVSTGVFVFDFDAVKQVLLETGDYLFENCRSRGIEFYLPLILEVFAAKGMIFDALLSEDADEFVGVNNRNDLTELNNILNKRRILKLKLMGVKFINPETVFLSPSTQIGAGSIVGPNVYLLNDNLIGENVVLEGFSFLKDTVIENNSIIKPFSHIEGAKIGRNCFIGPFARLRENTCLGDEVKIGNFVEAKNADLREGVKANHLSYIGDCFVGERSNIGAGTIFCNFDGFRKNFSSVGSDCLIGANVNLVAPLKIGSKVLVAAGSTVTRDVPDGSIFIERSEPNIILGGYDRYCQRKHT